MDGLSSVTSTNKSILRIVIVLVAALVALTACKSASNGNGNDGERKDPSNAQTSCQAPYVRVTARTINFADDPVRRTGTLALTGLTADGKALMIRNKETGVVTPLTALVPIKSDDTGVCLEYGLAPLLTQVLVTVILADADIGDYLVVEATGTDAHGRFGNLRGDQDGFEINVEGRFVAHSRVTL